MNTNSVDAIYRVQDDKGRGPFKPGKSHRWTDPDFAEGMQPLPTWLEEFGDLRPLMQPGEHVGCGLRTMEGIRRWFSPTERVRLRELGYKVVYMKVTRILAESENQLVFARREPLHKRVLVMPWSVV